MKTVGLFLIAASVIAAGFRASAGLAARRRALGVLILALGETASRIQLRQERDKILLSVFKCPFTVTEGHGGRLNVNCSALNKEDSALLCEFTDKLGLGDTASQLELCSIYAELFKKCMADAELQERQRAGMYRTCALLGALALAVLFI